MSFSTEVIARFPERRMIELTNDDSPQTATTIDTTRLDLAVADAEATFELECGIEPDDTVPMHVMAMTRGALFFLENWKGRDTGYLSNLQKGFFAALQSIRKKRKFVPKTNSKLSPSVERDNALPDMDRNRQPFIPGAKSQGSRIQLNANYCGDT